MAKVTVTRRILVVLAVAALSLFLLTIHLFYKAPADVAFLGDSLTQEWTYPQANLGIYGNTTAQMVARFPSQVPGHHYRRVVILGGTNDVLRGIDPQITIHNLQEIAELTIQAGAVPVLCEIPPIFRSPVSARNIDYSNRVRALNQQIAELAEKRKWSLINYYDSILGHPAYSSDGVHLKRRGYVVMEWTYLREAPYS